MNLSVSFAKARLVAILVLLVSTLQSVSGSSVAAADWAPANPPQIYDPAAGPNAVRRRDFIVDVCTTDTQLDCVESVAAYLNGAWVEGEATSTVNNGTGNIPNSRNWQIPGIVNLDGSGDIVTVMHLINYTGNLFLQTSVRASGANGDRDDRSLPRDVKFRATIRTSWVLPTHVSGKLADAKFTVAKLPASGASRVTMEGVPITHMVVLDDTTLTDPNGRGAYEIREFDMTVSDGRFYPIKKDCIEKPTIMTSENSFGHSLPTFSKGNLDLKLTAPHFRSDGTTEHIGLYEATVPMETAKCLWGNSIDKDAKFEVKVFETESTTKSATTSVVVTDEAVIIKASGFTFSSPTVRVSYSAPTPTPSTTTTTTPSTTTVAPVVGPAKPKGVKITRGATGATVGFTRSKGVSYKVVASLGSKRKTLSCKLTTAKVNCSAAGLTKGSWTVTITPRQRGVAGTPHTAKLKVS